MHARSPISDARERKLQAIRSRRPTTHFRLFSPCRGLVLIDGKVRRYGRFTVNGRIVGRDDGVLL